MGFYLFFYSTIFRESWPNPHAYECSYVFEKLPLQKYIIQQGLTLAHKPQAINFMD